MASRRGRVVSGLVLIVRLVVIGATMTMTAAWGSCLVPDGFGRFSGRQNEPRWPTTVPSDWPASPALEYTKSYFAHDLHEYNGNSFQKREYTHPPQQYADDAYGTTHVVTTLVGFPARCFLSHELREDDRRERLLRKTTVGEWNVALPIFGATTFPHIPIWRGLALNILFYDAIALTGWGLWQVAGAIRRHQRRRKGMCTHCGYDLKGLATAASEPGHACPECGGVR
jgi:hypothetical protein